jgi:hypothetical protein
MHDLDAFAFTAETDAGTGILCFAWSLKAEVVFDAVSMERMWIIAVIASEVLIVAYFYDTS